MAKIEIEGAFVEPWSKNQDAHPSWGMKTAESHRRKNDAGEYETTARTYRTVKVSRASGIDLTMFSKGDRVRVVGTEATEVREREGKKYYDLIVWADAVELVQGGAGARSGAGWHNPAAEQSSGVTGDSGGFGGGFEDFSDQNPF